jgi:hypothetical protein
MSYKITKKEIEQVSLLDAPSRYQHFVKRVTDWQEVWGLRTADGWASLAHESGNPAFALWPHPEYAMSLAQGLWHGYAPASINLDSLLNEWLPRMQADSISLAIFPTPSSKAVFAKANQLASDLALELQNYE